jgi:hypothetical protein
MYFTQVVEVETRESSADTNIIELGGSLVAARDQQPSSSPLLVTPAAFVCLDIPLTLPLQPSKVQLHDSQALEI